VNIFNPQEATYFVRTPLRATRVYTYIEKKDWFTVSFLKRDEIQFVNILCASEVP
jgi:hypothetical protein